MQTTHPQPAHPYPTPPPQQPPPAQPSGPQGFGAFLLLLWRGLDVISRLIFIGFVLFFFLLFLAALAGGEQPVLVPDRAALVIQPEGFLVEQMTGDPVSRAIGKATGDYEAETLLEDVLQALVAARDDDRIEAVYLDLDGLVGGGLDKLDRVRAELDAVRAAGKPVIAAGSMYGKAGYLLAASADEIFLHPMGGVLIDGYSRYRTYFAEGLEKFQIEPNVFRVGTFKSAVEPLIRDSMSDEAREANLEWLGDLWRSYLEQAAASRELTPEQLADGIERYDVLLEELDGDLSAVAVELGLVDRLTHPDEVREHMIGLVGENEETNSFEQISLGEYLKALGDDAPRFPTDGDGVGIVVASGTILDGEQPSGSIGGESTSALVRQARFDDSVKAVVLRVDSGGGSAFASEQIRRELELVREAGKPVVVSMGSVAASGGYWIATSSDEIWAHPDTITGSIGIFSYFPTIHKPLEEYLGMRVDGVGTTWLAGAARPDRPLEPRLGAMLQNLIEHGYDEFLERVSNARDMTTEQVDEIAQGRVWSGRDAHDLGLVDQLGSLDDAIRSAAALAQLEEGYAVRYVEEELDWLDQLFVDLLEEDMVGVGAVVRHLAAAVRPSGASARLLRQVEESARVLESFEDPLGLIAHCECEYR